MYVDESSGSSWFLRVGSMFSCPRGKSSQSKKKNMATLSVLDFRALSLMEGFVFSESGFLACPTRVYVYVQRVSIAGMLPWTEFAFSEPLTQIAFGRGPEDSEMLYVLDRKNSLHVVDVRRKVLTLHRFDVAPLIRGLLSNGRVVRFAACKLWVALSVTGTGEDGVLVLAMHDAVAPEWTLRLDGVAKDLLFTQGGQHLAVLRRSRQRRQKRFSLELHRIRDGVLDGFLFQNSSKAMSYPTQCRDGSWMIVEDCGRYDSILHGFGHRDLRPVWHDNSSLFYGLGVVPDIGVVAGNHRATVLLTTPDQANIGSSQSKGGMNGSDIGTMDVLGHQPSELSRMLAIGRQVRRHDRF